MTCKKILRAQRIALENRLPLVYLVDSAGAFLPLQDEVFPDEDDFGRVFRNNAVISAAGVPQLAAIMGNCVAGGGYLPVLCDKLLMTDGSGLYLAGPALVKAAIGQTVGHEELGGASMHAAISGTIDFREPDDQACLERLRRLIEVLPEWSTRMDRGRAPARPTSDLYSLYPFKDGRSGEYDIRDLLSCILDAPLDECGGIRPNAACVMADRRRPHRRGRQLAQTLQAVIRPVAIRRRDHADSATSRAVHHGLRRARRCFSSGHVNGFMVGRDSNSRIIRGAARQRHRQQRRAEADGYPRRLVQGRPYALCGKALTTFILLADRPLRRHGRRTGRQHTIGYHAQRAQARRPCARRSRVGGSASKGSSKLRRTDRRPLCGRPIMDRPGARSRRYSRCLVAGPRSCHSL